MSSSVGARTNHANKFRLLPLPLFMVLFHVNSIIGLISLMPGKVSAQSSGFNEAKFTELVEKVEADAIELARKVEELYQNRCEATLLADCFRGNYDHCLSTYPEQTCPGGLDLNTPECGDGFTCSTLYSFSTTSVALPRESARGPDRNPTDPQVIETICFTKGLDAYFEQKRAEDEAFWSELGFQPNFMYFGSHNGGAFRLSPATHYSSCNSFDPRLRPWYVAASSGPKNIIMVLDQSGSMFYDGKIEALKEAAKRVIETTTVSDRIAIVTFNNTATEISDGGLMYIATEENKQSLMDEVDAIFPKGGTNFHDGFVAAFDVLDRSIANEVNVNCNTAIIFLTDGLMDTINGPDEDDVVDLVLERLNVSSTALRKPIQLFSYSVSGGDPEIDEFPKRLACATGTGVFSKIEYEEDIVDSLASYYRLFALGLGSGPNEDFTAWVEPYRFFTRGAYGTTVSAPVYDNSKSPPLFLGVVGIDFVLDALDAALGINDTSSNESFQRVVKRSFARCPRLELTDCELESYRRQSNTVGDDALCNADCAEEDFVQVTEEKCPGVSDYPGDLWTNLSNKGVAYSDRACCRVDAPIVEPDPTCTAPPTPEPTEPPIEDESGPPIALIVGPVVGGCILLIAAVVFYLKCCKEGKSERAEVHAIPPTAEVTVHNNEDESAPSQPGQIHLNSNYTASIEPRLPQQQPESEPTLSLVSQRRDGMSAAQHDSGTVVAEPISGTMGTLQNVQQAPGELLGAGPEFKDQCRPLDDPRQPPTSDSGNNSSSLLGTTNNTEGSNGEAGSSTPNNETCSAASTSGKNNNVAETVEVPLAAVPAPAPTSADLPVEASPMIGPSSHIPAASNDSGDHSDDVVAFRLDG